MSCFYAIVGHSMSTKYTALRGTKDILPEEMDRWRTVEDSVRRIFGLYGFEEIRTPIIEPLELFVRAVGEETDIVHKEMFTLSCGDETACLRPENTASVVRAVVQHSLHRAIASGYPARYYYLGPMFRYERPQKGRQRQFHQIGAEILGAAEPLADAETLEMLWRFLGELGVAEKELVLNTLGDDDCRARFREALVTWLSVESQHLCEDCRRRAKENPLRVLDCKVEQDRKRLELAPSIHEFLGVEDEAHFKEVLAMLEQFGIPYRVDSRMVRGLDYYERTVFEVTSSELGAQNAILGGGRYDGLMEDLGGPQVPGFGFAIGMERLVALLPDKVVNTGTPALALICLGEAGLHGAISLARRLRDAGLAVRMPLLVRPMGAQMRRASKSGAGHALFVGEAELAEGRFGLKNLETGEQVTVDEAELITMLGAQS